MENKEDVAMFGALEQKIADLEAHFPIDVKIVVSKSGGHYPVGLLRGLILLLAVICGVFWMLWMPLPQWLMVLVFLCLAFFPLSLFGIDRLGRYFVSRPVKAAEVQRLAQRAFVDFHVGETEARNGILLFVSLPEKKVYLLPDTQLSKALGQKFWDALVAKFVSDLGATQKSKGKSLLGVSSALSQMIDDLGTAFKGKLPEGSFQKAGSLGNTIEVI